MKFRKKPTIMEAVRWTGENVAEVTTFLYENGDGGKFAFGGIEFKTIHGETAIARKGDWIVAEPQRGRYYPVKNDIFEANYEMAPNA